MNCYKLYGSTIYSDLEFPQLVQTKEWNQGKCDIFIQAGILPEDIKRQEPIRKYRIDRNKSWLINSTAWIMVEEGKHITYELKTDGKLEYLRTYLLGFAMSMLFLQRGEMALHCSAVVKGDKAILVAGESGSGKSTVTSYLIEKGYQLMADDMSVVRVTKTGLVKVLPGFPYQKLCRDTAIQLGYQLKDCIYIDEKKDKFLVPYVNEFSLEAKTLETIFLLECDRREGNLKLEELRGMDKLFACMKHLFLKSLLMEQTFEGYVGERCLQIASKVPMYRINRPLGQDTVNTVIESILSIAEVSIPVLKQVSIRSGE